ncbi:ABC transporter ATP-binding protein [Brevibacterium sp. UMB1308A]|uniref:ABC transporter ATP-binding protein n=1 Tax=Brevibacterium sp. UMB1308A TaxID=3050608 RepID=UPI00254B809B|nr:ABC transporter ATP-binding protein [Brevibacterium sp. UMB1308A]MDK8345497.1 ABC transporter ATP-binding protein [Brevibacterium sp. UMB1308B]MDK8712658.1 ABC transporter ATP-binding protein [Brevibacterium sp. UMB1308A]
MTQTPKETPNLLTIQDLEVSFTTMHGKVQAVEGASMELPAGGTLAIVGESGSGKSTTAMATIGLLPGSGKVTAGSIVFDGQELVGLAEPKMRSIRGRQIGLVPQDPMSNLNPVSRIGTQISETLLTHKLATKQTVQEQVVEVMAQAGIPEPERRAKQFPHELSGGLRQRALIAIALACKPKLLIADEPTSALDVTVQQVILDQIDSMTAELGTSVLLITHDLGLAAERAQNLVVMHRGKVVEFGSSRQLLEDPQHPYTQSLVKAAPSVAAARLLTQEHTTEDTGAEAKEEEKPLVEISGLTKVYPIRGQDDFYAAKNVSLEIPRGKTVSIVGESGSGKTTTARMLLKLIEPTEGSITFEGKDVLALKGKDLKDFRQRVQAVFQDPYSSLNPMFTVGKIIEEPLAAYKRGNAAERRKRVLELMEQVALPQHFYRRYPAELSGGQRQRISIARALALNPDLIVCDEPVSALDVLVQDQILNLLKNLQEELGLSYLFISHDLAVVRLISDYVCVMKDGELVEASTSEEVFTNPRHPYTRKLLASIPGNELGIDEAS